MLGIAAAIVFGIAFVIAATTTSTSVVFAPSTLILAGLCLLALHLSGVGTAWNLNSRRR